VVAWTEHAERDLLATGSCLDDSNPSADEDVECLGLVSFFDDRATELEREGDEAGFYERAQLCRDQIQHRQPGENVCPSHHVHYVLVMRPTAMVPLVLVPLV
jgi:hypothetical protein